MNINGTIDKTFFNAELYVQKKTTAKLVRLPEKKEEPDDNFYSNFLQKIKHDDLRTPKNSKLRKSEQFNQNILDIQGRTNSRDLCNLSRKSVGDILVIQTEEVAKSSNLNPRKLKRESNAGGGSNMILAIPGMSGQEHPKKKNSSIFSHTRKKSSGSNIKMKDLRETDNIQNRDRDRDREDQDDSPPKSGRNHCIITETMRSNASNVLKIMIPQSNQLKELGDEINEETNKLEIQAKVIQIEVIGTKQPLPPHSFIFDSLKIQKLNSIKELSSKKQDNDEVQKSVAILNQIKSKMTPDHRINPRESQIIIINQNEFNRFPSVNDKINNKQSKSRLFCCVPVK